MSACSDLSLFCRGRDALAEAAQWWTLAAKGGDPIAQYLMGLGYLHGIGLVRDPALARNWLEQAAHQGLTDAMVLAGSMALGVVPGIPRDPVTAYAWFQLAAERGRADATVGLELLEQVMAPAAIGKAKAVAETWAMGRGEGAER